jgi:outer membrane protein OmpA-like peptidoglycan-associated protein
MNNPLKNVSFAGKAFIAVCIVALLWGGSWVYRKAFPEKVKKAEIKTKVTSLPPLAYDKASNATFRPLPSFNEPADVQAAEMRGAIMGWNAFCGANYAVGGTSTSVGSIAQELGLNIRLAVQNSCSKQGDELYAFAQELHDGVPNPTKGVHFINWMGDGVGNYITGLNARLVKDFGPEFRAKVVTFTGASFGEDKWMLKPKYAKNAIGSLTSTVIRDGDWNIAIIKSQLMGWPVNHNLGTYDRTKVNFVAAPNDEYTEAGRMYTTGEKVTLKIIENGKYTGKDTTMSVNGVSSWFPVDQQVVEQKGGLTTVASTKDFGAQMACAIIMIDKWAQDNRLLVENLIEAFGRGGDQVKSHDEALRFGCQVSEVVFADKEKNADAWYNAYKSFDMTDEDGNTVNIGGSRVFNIADAAAYTGVAGGSDTYKRIYNTFSAICVEAYPEVLPAYDEYSTVVDWSYLKAVYNKTKSKGLAGNVSKVDFTSKQKGDVIGDASYSIQFNLGSDVIKPESYTVLEKVIGQLAATNDAFIEINGHTDVTGDDVSNMELSKKRAASVLKYLISKGEAGLDARASSNGYGETKPLPGVLPTDARNRRVEIKVFRSK